MPLPRAGEYHRRPPIPAALVDAAVYDRNSRVHFGVWHPISEASTAAPEAAGVLQTRAEGVMDYRSGRSAMVLYACSDAGETLRGFVAGRGARELDRAISAGARWIRFAADARTRAASWTACSRASSNASARRPSATPAQRPPAPPPTTPRQKRTRAEQPDARDRGSGLTYRGAGVDIDAGDALVERIKPHVRRTLRPEVMTDLGGFAGLCALPDPLQASRCWCRAPTASAPS